MHHYLGELIDVLLVLVAAWMVLAVTFVIYAYFARLKYPVSESVFGRVVVISFFIITTSIWLPIIVGALALSLVGHLWSRFKTRPRVDSANRHRSCSTDGADRLGHDAPFKMHRHRNWNRPEGDADRLTRQARVLGGLAGAL